MDTGVFTGEQPMSEAWQTFRAFVERTEDLPISMLVSGGAAVRWSMGSIAAYDAPLPGAGVEGRRARISLADPDVPGACPVRAEGSGVLEALAEDGRPKLHLWADSDPIIPPKVGARFAERINADPPEVIENASHFLQEDAGEEIGARIASWLSEAG